MPTQFVGHSQGRFCGNGWFYFFFFVLVWCLVVVVCFLAFLGQFVTVILVFWVVVLLFCAVMVVGICSGWGMVCLVVLVVCLVCPWVLMVIFLWVVMVVVGLQRFPFAARAECGPSGRIVWKLVMGASGIVSNL